MKIEFCPSCGGIDVKKLAAGQLQCGKCKYTGEMREGSMDEINAYVKSLKSGVRPPLPGQGTAINTNTSVSQLKAKLNSMKGTKTGDVEFL